MVNLITGPKGSGKTQQIIALANDKVKTTNGNVVLIKKSHRDTYSVDFNVRAICMTDYPDIETPEEFAGFIYGMVAGNHDIETIFIDGVLKQANLSIDSLPDFLGRLDKLSKDDNIEFYISVSLDQGALSTLDVSNYNLI